MGVLVKKHISIRPLLMILVGCSIVLANPYGIRADMETLIGQYIPNGMFYSSYTPAGVVVPMVGVGADGNTKINAGSGSAMDFQRNQSTLWRIDGSSNLVANFTGPVVGPLTSDGSDNNSICVSGGSTCAQNRGGYIKLNGNEEAAQDGSIQIEAGDSDIQFRAGNSGALRINANRSLEMQSAGAAFIQAPFTGTPVATPVAGTNYCNGACVIPTAAANAAVFIGAGTTPTPGVQHLITNSNTANTVRAKAVGASTINGSVAGGYIGLAPNTSMRCWQASATNLICDSYSGGAVPTPAGP